MTRYCAVIEFVDPDDYADINNVGENLADALDHIYTDYSISSIEQITYSQEEALQQIKDYANKNKQLDPNIILDIINKVN